MVIIDNPYSYWYEFWFKFAEEPSAEAASNHIWRCDRRGETIL